MQIPCKTDALRSTDISYDDQSYSGRFPTPLLRGEPSGHLPAGLNRLKEGALRVVDASPSVQRGQLSREQGR